MKLRHCIIALGLAITLGGCATASKERMREVREFAAESAKLDAFAELSERYRDTYQREQPYLSRQADARERELDVRRRAAYDDIVRIQQAVVRYLHTLGTLAGAEQKRHPAPAAQAGAAIQSWPDSGIDERHVAAYTSLTTLVANTLSAPYQDRAVRAMVNDGDAPLRSLLDAMAALLRYYDKTGANEKRIVLGLFDIEIAFADAPRDRLLATLARAHQQNKAAEYSLVERRHRVAEHNLAALIQGQRALAAQLGQPPEPTPAAPGADVRASRAAPDASQH
ncbi:hypothetical protein ACFDR9_003415 [Janthinobacterium sp. CG_23.3]|uniref:hypothetical protein n=1 Tax=unclassified Janthinobacterium TaxID=2610881 RepID=UPI0003497162|nr:MULTISPECIES: hypothetical protein [unclassified Janthinobacterium]MEC5163664.1 hypothetical protein [Janthinobacterium sp. CG_S6]